MTDTNERSSQEQPANDVKLGYIGLGNMGAPMAKRLVEWPGGLTVFDVRTEAMTPLAELGASLADSVADGAADKGELAVMVGADREVYERIKPAFKQFASLVIHAGEAGAGTRMKLARNMLTFTSYAAACEAMKLAEAAGVDLQQLGRVVRHTDALTGGPGAIMVREDMSTLTPDHWLHDAFTHTRGLGEKDLSLALALGEATGTELPLAELALQRLAEGLGVPHNASTARE